MRSKVVSNLVVGASPELSVAGERAVIDLTRACTAVRLDVEVRAGDGRLRTTSRALHGGSHLQDRAGCIHAALRLTQGVVLHLEQLCR